MLLSEGNLPAARTYWLECLNHALALEQPQVIVKALEGFAQLAGAAGQAQPAARLWGLTTGIRATLKYPVPTFLKQVHQQAQELTCASLDAATWSSAFREGTTMSIEQAVPLVLREI